MTEKEKRELIVSELNKNMFVEAGAGAGKTTLIVLRIINQLMSGVQPGEIVAITFTNAATGELKDRILSKAAECAKKDDGTYSEEQLKNLRAALDHLDQMQISTIHSFCYRILSERIFDAKLPVGFRLLMEDEAAQIRDRGFGLWAERLDKNDWDSLLFRGGYRYRSLDSIKKLMIQFENLAGDFDIKTAVKGEDEQKVRTELGPVLNKVRADALAMVNESYMQTYADFTEVEDEYLTTYGKSLRDALRADELPGIIGVMSKLPATKVFVLRAVTVKAMKEMKIPGNDQSSFKEKAAESDQELRGFLESVKDDLERLLMEYTNLQYERYIEYAKKARGAIREIAGTGALTNNTILEKTKELLETSADAADHFRRAFRAIYVDEFQDTDHIQESFIRLLAADPDDSGKLRDGALFVVGDPKQSIYRFRGAEPEIYFKTKEYMSTLDNACVLELSDNYRSCDRVINWVNDSFKELPITGEDIRYIPMVARYSLPDSVPDRLIAGIYKNVSPETVRDGISSSDDALALCHLINAMVGRYLIAEKDDRGQYHYREIKYSDFLILSMNTFGMGDYISAFHRNNIPVVTDSRQDVSADPDMAAFIAFYRYLTYPYDKAAFVGALEALWHTGACDIGKNEELLKGLYKETEEMSAYGCVRFLLERPWLFLPKHAEMEEYETETLMRRLIQMTEEAAISGCGNRQGILGRMEDYCTKNVEHELLLEKDVNAVSFMNLHKAKGLEGEIVVWTNRRENKSFRMGSYRNGSDFFPSLDYKDKNGMTRLAWAGIKGDNALIKKAEREDRYEVIRLEYVAVTRAKQAVIFMDRLNKDAGNLFSEFDLASLPSIEYVLEGYDPLAGAVGAVNTLSLAAGYDEETVKELGEPVFSSESPSDYEKAVAGAASDKDEVQKESENVLKRPVGPVFGTVMHRCFELLISRLTLNYEGSGLDTGRVVDACIIQAMNENLDEIPAGQTEDYKAFLHEAMMAFGQWFKNSEIIRGCDKWYPELPFSYQKDKVWLHGEADLVLAGDDGRYLVLDYKSDNDEKHPDEALFEKRLRDKYAPQVSAYREAICRVFGADPGKVRAYLVSFSQKDTKPGEKLRVRVTEVREYEELCQEKRNIKMG